MIPADKQWWFDAFFHRYNTRALRKHFSKLHLSGLENLESLDRSLPILLFGNHSCWWDGLIDYFLAKEVFDLNFFVMMEEKQMIRYKFFRWVGAFSVNRDSPKEAVTSMCYAASLFSEPNRAVWIYPQGVMLPNDTRPLDFYSGVARIASMAGTKVQLVPFAHRYEFMMEQRPEAFTILGKPQILEEQLDHRQRTAQCATTITMLLDSLRCTIAKNDLTAFTPVLSGAHSTNTIYDAVRFKK